MGALAELLAVLTGVFQFYGDIKAFLAARQAVTDEQWKANGALILKAIQEAKTDDDRWKALRLESEHLSDL